MNNESERKKFAVAFREKYSPYANYSDWDICEHTGRREFEGWLLARAALSQPQELPPLPSGYAYEYPGPYGGIQFTNGETRNGSEPIRAIPYYFAAPPSIAPLTDEQFSAIVDRASDECDAWSDSQDGEPTINETKAYFARRIIAQARGQK